MLNLLVLGILPTERLRSKYFILSDSFCPIQALILIRLGLLPPTPSLNSAKTKAASQTVTAAILGSHRSMQCLSPLETLLTVIGDSVVERHIYFDHASLGLHTQFGGWRAGSIIGTVGVLKDKQTAAKRKCRVDEDIVSRGDGVIVVVVYRGGIGGGCGWLNAGIDVHSFDVH
jgi:hypothetical protein